MIQRIISYFKKRNQIRTLKQKLSKAKLREQAIVLCYHQAKDKTYLNQLFNEVTKEIGDLEAQLKDLT